MRPGPHPGGDGGEIDREVLNLALLKRIAGYLLPYWPKLALALIAILLSALFSLMPAVLTGRMIDEGLIGGNFSMLLALIAAAFGVLVLSNLIDVARSWLNVWVAQHITCDLRNHLYGHLLQMPHRFFTGTRQGDIVTRMTSDVDAVQSVIAGTLTSIVSNAAILVLAAVAMYQKNWILATTGIIMVPLFIVPTRRVGRKRWEFTHQAQKKQDEANQILSETMGVSGQLLVKLFTGERIEYEKYERVNAELAVLNIRQNMAGRWFHAAMNTFTNAGPMLIYLAGGVLMLRFADGNLTVGDITVMVALLERLYRPVNSLLTIHVDVMRSMAVFSRIFEYCDLRPEVEERVDSIVPYAAGEPRMAGELTFRNVDFAYEPGQPVLRDISFTVPAGRTLAVVGPSGSGKSTIIGLIPRLFDVTAGSIALGGTDIRDLSLTWLRRNVGLVTQDSHLFNGTIRENLLYARPEASSQEIEKACREADIHDFITSLPQGYDTEVGNRGIKLSGGEKQRLAIARVLLKNPKVIILDEATSALDSITESRIQRALEPLLRGRTSIVVAHRLSTVMAADEILVLQGGRIAERGTHDALLQSGTLYRELHRTQFRLAA